MLLGGLAGTLFGLLIVRRRGVYFAMVTIAFGQLWYYLAYSWNDLHRRLRRPARVSSRSRSVSGPDARHPLRRRQLLLFPAALFAAGGGAARPSFCARPSATPCGRSARTSAARASSASRSNARSGSSFSISCFFTALAGTLYALLNNFADPWRLHYSLSGYFVVMCVMGGMRTLLGPAAGRGRVRRAAGLSIVR